MKTLFLGLALALTLSACATTGSGSQGRNNNLLTRAEIEEAKQMNALELVRSERPQWLFRRGNRTISGNSDIVVYLDGTRIGGPDALANIPAISIHGMRFYSDREAQFKWGVGHLHGAIEVISSRG